MITFFCSKLPVYIYAFICFIDNCQERKAALRAWSKRLEAECEALEKALAEVKIKAEEKKKRAEERKKAGLPENDGPGGEGSYQRPKRMYGRSDFRGVYRSDSNKWMARITVAGKKLSLGSFSTEIAAAQAYDGACVLRGIQKSLSLSYFSFFLSHNFFFYLAITAASKKYFGEKSKLNFDEDGNMLGKAAAAAAAKSATSPADGELKEEEKKATDDEGGIATEVAATDGKSEVGANMEAEAEVAPDTAMDTAAAAYDLMATDLPAESVVAPPPVVAS